MLVVADLHVHSRHSRATSPDLGLVSLHRAALLSGVTLMATGDFTHPGYFAELEAGLEPAEDGLFRLSPDLRREAERDVPACCRREVRFMLEVEVSSIYKKAGRVRKNHNLVYVPSLDAARSLSAKLASIGNLASDGRPILGLDARDLLEITLETDPLAFLVPAHIWTPHFSLLGSQSGFDSVKECFGDLAGHIFAVETGLSSDPAMNWRVSQLDRIALVSSSDAHSPAKVAREATLFDIELSYEGVLRALQTRQGLLGTVEFFPEEGKYHLDGHRRCGVRLTPEERRAHAGKCPTCGEAVTVGVLSRVDELADRSDGVRPSSAAAYQCLVPLAEVVGETLGVGAQARSVRTLLEHVRAELGPELVVLREVPIEDIGRAGGAALAEAVRRVRSGELAILAGYDGEYGAVRIFRDGEREQLAGQMALLGGPARTRPHHLRRSRPASGEDAASAERTNKEPATKDCAPLAAPGACPAPGCTAPSREDPLGGLDPAQRRAASTLSGPLVIVAGPGSGKTRTLVARIAHQICTGHVQPEAVLAIAFTRQAVEELRERLGRSLEPQAAERVTVTTFHGFGLALLTELGGAPRLVDDDERIAFVAAASSVGEREARRILEQISRAKQRVEPRAALHRDMVLLAAYDAYQARLETAGACDVDDLVLGPVVLLSANPRAAEAQAARWRSVSVDEYQDVNDVQAALVRLLCPAGTNLAVIGDPNQAIYGFRGAEPGHFARFAQVFPGAERIRLEQSYRLSRQVLRAAESVLPEPSGLRDSGAGLPVEVIACPTAASEADRSWCVSSGWSAARAGSPSIPDAVRRRRS